MRQRSTETGRNPLIDFAKGWLILLVVFGHAIQYAGHDDEGYWDDPFYKAVYLFHMPLFIAISGYLARSGIVRSAFADLMRRRFGQLIVPILVWAVVVQGARILLHGIEDGFSIAATLAALKKIPGEAAYGFWFLWALFFAIAVVAALRAMGRDGPAGLTLVCLGSLWLPEFGNAYLCKFVLPFFCMGYWIAGGSLPAMRDDARFWLLVLPLLACLYLSWDRGTYIYVSRMTPTFGNWWHIIHRLLAGVTGSVVFLALIRRLFRRWPARWIITCGERSLTIYIIQTYAFLILSHFSLPLQNTLAFSVLLAPALTLAVTAGSLAIGAAVGSIKSAQWFLFGVRGSPASISSR